MVKGRGLLMFKKRGNIVLCILGCLIGILAVYSYANLNKENDFMINEVNWNASAKMWTDNTEKDIYDVSFKFFDGTEVKEIIASKSNYEMKINTNIKNGDLNVKIYNENKVLLDQDGNVNETIAVLNNENENIKVEINGKDAQGSIKIKLI